jgi:oxazoline/thiazoline dehydrogenase
VDPSWVLSLPECVTVSAEAGAALLLLGPQSRLVLRRLSPGLRDALSRLTAPGDRASRLAESVLTADGPNALARWHYHLRQLAERGLLQLSVDAGEDRLATLEPIAPGFALTPTAPVSSQPYVLSRFGYMHRSGRCLMLESPLSYARIVLRDPRAASVVHRLAEPATLADFEARVYGLPAEAVASLLSLLVKGGMACAIGEDGATAEDADPALFSWEFHDLLFHTRSREGRHNAPIGATYPLAGQFEPPPARKPLAAVKWIDLYRPDLEQLKRHDPSFAAVLEQRRSLRNYAAEAITDQQLGEFLFRVAREKEYQRMKVITPMGPIPMEFARRPYPAGGALYELEVYAVVKACRGLPAGLYHYDSQGHRLGCLESQSSAVERLLSDAGRATGIAAETLQILLILTARIPRIAWKYASLAYALSLKHVGVVYQTMYLAATAMGLAPCAVGSGNSDLFARAAGVSYYAEPAVGEFLLGSKGE